jgi:hypothetical protein
MTASVTARPLWLPSSQELLGSNAASGLGGDSQIARWIPACTMRKAMKRKRHTPELLCQTSSFEALSPMVRQPYGMC